MRLPSDSSPPRGPVGGGRAPQARRGLLAWAARHAGRLALGALALAAGQTCREYDSAGRYALRIGGARAARVAGPARGHRNPLLSSTSHDYSLTLELPAASTAGYGAAALTFVSPARPGVGTYPVGDGAAGGRAPGAIRVLFTSEAFRGPSGGIEAWRTLGGAVRITRARWWADGLAGTFEARFARRAAARVDTIAIAGSFATR